MPSTYSGYADNGFVTGRVRTMLGETSAETPTVPPVGDVRSDGPMGLQRRPGSVAAARDKPRTRAPPFCKWGDSIFGRV